jgi:hypothetical protein
MRERDENGDWRREKERERISERERKGERERETNSPLHRKWIPIVMLV